MFLRLRIVIGYLVARRLFHWKLAMQQPWLWEWMQGQFARKAATGDVAAQSFYGHILLFRGTGPGSRDEGKRMLLQAAQGGDAKAAYQIGVLCSKGQIAGADPQADAKKWWTLAAAKGHAGAAGRLAQDI